MQQRNLGAPSAEYAAASAWHLTGRPVVRTERVEVAA